MTSLAIELPKEINRVRGIQDQFKEIRSLPNVMVEPQIAMMEQEIQTAINAISSGDLIAMIQSYENLKGYTG